jgi:hypothetical protein
MVMAESRFHMTTIDGTGFVEMPDTAIGLAFLVGLRKGRKDLFGHQRIKSVLQMHPSLIPVGQFVNMSRFRTTQVKAQVCSQKLLDGVRRAMSFAMFRTDDKVYADAITALDQMYLGVERNR